MAINSIERRKQFLAVIAGPTVFVLLIMLLHGMFGLKESVAVATTAWMALWWIVRPVNIAVTALLPIAINAFFDLIPMEQIISQYFSEIIVLLLGADIICLTWHTTGLDKRLSVKTLCMIGTSMKQQIAMWLITAVVLSMFLPNVVVCAIMTPVAVSMLSFIGETNIKTSKIAMPILLAIAWGSGIGGLGTPLGSAANLVAINYLENVSGHEFMYIDWVVRFLPFLAVILLLNLLFLFSLKLPVTHIQGTKLYFTEAYRKLGKIKQSELTSLFLFIAGIVLAFIRPLYADLLPGMKPAYVFFTLSLLAFIIKDGEGKVLISWNEAERGIMWGMLFLIAGGLALGKLVIGTGLAARIAQMIAEVNLTGGIATILIFTLFTCVLSEISSNTAAAAITVPVIASITTALGLDPIPYLFITVVAFNCAYILPLSTRAIPISYGLEPYDLICEGSKLAIISIITITTVGYLLIRFWPLFSTL